MGLYTSIRRSINYRLGRLYNSFYYGQSNNKYVMLFVFPSLIWYIRYRTDTKLGYRLYISPSAGGPLDYLTPYSAAELKEAQAEKEDSIQRKVLVFFNDAVEWLKDTVNGTAPIVSNWKNGKKIYLSDDLTVEALKKLVYGKNFEQFQDVIVSCKGRIMSDQDNLALATRAFCKRDPRLILWKDT